MTAPRPSDTDNPGPLPTQRIIAAWWPLALSWLLIAIEGPALNAVVARLSRPDINLAAFGGVVYPLALIIEAPIIMLLSASTALCKDWDSYRRLKRFMMIMGAALTVIHLLVAFTPLYDLLVVRLIGAPPEIVEPARKGLMILVPWSWAIGYRRFKQGVLIRFGHSRAVGAGTFVRLSADASVLAAGYLLGTVPGAVVAAAALTAGVVSEAVFAGLRARPVIRDEVRDAPVAGERLTLPFFIDFYTPLAMTSLLLLFAEPLSSAALSRMPQPLESLAVWSIVTGFVFLLRSFGVAYSEVVIALLDEPRSVGSLRRFMVKLTVVVTVLLLAVALTPLSMVWFDRVMGLRRELALFSRQGLWFALLIPGLNVLQSWYQGLLMHGRRTRAITEAVAMFLVVTGAILLAGALWHRVAGLYVALTAISVGRLAQTAWLWHRSRRTMACMEQQDEAAAQLQAADICAG